MPARCRRCRIDHLSFDEAEDLIISLRGELLEKQGKASQ